MAKKRKKNQSRRPIAASGTEIGPAMFAVFVAHQRNEEVLQQLFSWLDEHAAHRRGKQVWLVSFESATSGRIECGGCGAHLRGDDASDDLLQQKVFWLLSEYVAPACRAKEQQSS